jgi:hypothetical protein
MEQLLGLYAYVLPFVLYAAWTALTFFDLARREDLSSWVTALWVLVVLLVPFLGAIAYLAVGGGTIAARVRGSVLAGGVGAYVLVLGLTLALGGAR